MEVLPFGQTGGAVIPPQAQDIAPTSASPPSDQASLDAAPQEQPLAVDGQQPQELPEFQFELPSGSKYRTQDDLVRGATEKDFTIERLKGEIQSLKNGVQQQPALPQDPQKAAMDYVNQNAPQFEARLKALFPGAPEEQIKEQARINALSAYEAIEVQRVEARQEAKMSEWRQFIASQPDLRGSLAQEVWDNQVRTFGRDFYDPYEHLNAVHAEMHRRGIKPTSPTLNGVNGAVNQAQNQQRLFPNANGAAPTQRDALPPHVQAAVDQARAKGLGDEAVARIQQTAAGFNPQAFTGRGF